jgi:hypothetical protein
MPTYECTITPGFRSMEIDAVNAQEARKMFAELVRENIDTTHINATNLDSDDGEDVPERGRG